MWQSKLLLRQRGASQFNDAEPQRPGQDQAHGDSFGALEGFSGIDGALPEVPARPGAAWADTQKHDQAHRPVGRISAKGKLNGMDLVVFEYDQSYVLECFRRGEFDFVDGVSEVAETEFFRYIGAKKILGKLAETYPSPREKEEVPLWMYVASNLSMRLHGVHSFHAYPYVIRCGGMLNASGPESKNAIVNSSASSP
jgi:hypothetical protein